MVGIAAATKISCGDFDRLLVHAAYATATAAIPTAHMALHAVTNSRSHGARRTGSAGL